MTHGTAPSGAAQRPHMRSLVQRGITYLWKFGNQGSDIMSCNRDCECNKLQVAQANHIQIEVVSVPGLHRRYSCSKVWRPL